MIEQLGVGEVPEVVGAGADKRAAHLPLARVVRSHRQRPGAEEVVQIA